jgi:hypothetical protein
MISKQMEMCLQLPTLVLKDIEDVNGLVEVGAQLAAELSRVGNGKLQLGVGEVAPKLWVVVAVRFQVWSVWYNCLDDYHARRVSIPHGKDVQVAGGHVFFPMEAITNPLRIHGQEVVGSKETSGMDGSTVESRLSADTQHLVQQTSIHRVIGEDSLVHGRGHV